MSCKAQKVKAGFQSECWMDSEWREDKKKTKERPDRALLVQSYATTWHVN
jgi:hypothetical protein